MDGESFTHPAKLCEKGRAARPIACRKLEEGSRRGVGRNVVKLMIVFSYVILPEQYNGRINSENFFLISP